MALPETTPTSNHHHRLPPLPLPQEKKVWSPHIRRGWAGLGRSSLEVAIRLVMQLAVRHQLLHAGEALGAAEG